MTPDRILRKLHHSHNDVIVIDPSEPGLLAMLPTGGTLVIIGSPLDWDDATRAAVTSRIANRPDATVAIIFVGDLTLLDPDGLERWACDLGTRKLQSIPGEPTVILLVPGDAHNVPRRIHGFAAVILDALRSDIRQSARDRNIAELEWSALANDYLHRGEQLAAAQAIRNTISFRLGHLLVTAARGPRHGIGALRRFRRRLDADEVLNAPSPLRLPERTIRTSHPDRELLWIFRTLPTTPFAAAIAGRDTLAAYPSLVSLRPHDALAALGATQPNMLILESGAAAPGEAWTGIGTAARRHLAERLEEVVDLARRRSIPLVLWQTGPDSEAEWFARFRSPTTLTAVDPDKTSTTADIEIRRSEAGAAQRLIAAGLDQCNFR